MIYAVVALVAVVLVVAIWSNTRHCWHMGEGLERERHGLPERYSGELMREWRCCKHPDEIKWRRAGW
jgi:predicted alpha/beta hydrolase